ncbi:MAG: hypothetical protein ACLFSV_10980 [Alkalispirochaeta sp.]
MKEPWKVYATILTAGLVVASVAMVVTVGIDLFVIAGSIDEGGEEFVLWELGTRAEGSDEARGNALGAIVLFSVIPIVAYTAAVSSFRRHRKMPFVVIGVLQLVILLGVALPVLGILLRSFL